MSALLPQLPEAIDIGRDLAGLAQDNYFHRNDLRWSEIDYFLQVRQVRVDILNNIREDLQDLHDKDQTMLDTSLVVAALMLEIGFGFSVQGTFPPEHSSRSLRLLYTVLAALALICPLFSLLGLLECRRRLYVFMKTANRRFHRRSRYEIKVLLRHHVTNFERMVAAARRETRALPYWNPFRRTPTPDHSEALLNTTGTIAPKARSHLGPVDRDDERGAPLDTCLKMHDDYLRFWTVWTEPIMFRAQIATTLGVGANVLCAAVLLGLYWQRAYPDTPMMWKSFTLILVWACGMGFVAWTFSIIMLPEMNNKVTRDGTGIPPWAKDVGRSRSGSPGVCTANALMLTVIVALVTLLTLGIICYGETV